MLLLDKASTDSVCQIILASHSVTQRIPFLDYVINDNYNLVSRPCAESNAVDGIDIQIKLTVAPVLGGPTVMVDVNIGELFSVSMSEAGNPYYHPHFPTNRNSKRGYTELFRSADGALWEARFTLFTHAGDYSFASASISETWLTRKQLTGQPQVQKDFVKVIAHYEQTCALISDGSIKCWGHQWDWEQSYTESSFQSNVPVVVSGISNATEIVSNQDTRYPSRSVKCAIVDGGSVKCWG